MSLRFKSILQSCQKVCSAMNTKFDVWSLVAQVANGESDVIAETISNGLQSDDCCVACNNELLQKKKKQHVWGGNRTERYSTAHRSSA
jgi:hypothetical protein